MPDSAPLRANDPERIGSYRLTGRLGEGGQGVVYLGEDADGRGVAVKLLHAQFTGDAKARARFAGELASAKRVAPFCTAQILDADVEGDTPYLVSEFIDGPSLREVVDTQGPSSGSALQRLAIGTVTALAAIHEAGIVHRDFKPTNVLLASDGPRVIDFGIARALDAGGTLTSTTVGTPSYMSPEQISGQPAGPPTDVFAWACTIVYAATGSPPFGQDSIPAVMNRILNQEPALGMLMGPLRDIVSSCLAKDASRRPTAQRILLRLLGNEGVILQGSGSDSPATVLNQGAQVAAAEAPAPSGWTPPSPYGPADAPPPGMYHPGGDTAPPSLYGPGDTSPRGPYAPGSDPYSPGGNTPNTNPYGPGGNTPYPGIPPTSPGYTPRPRGRVQPGAIAGAAAATVLLVTVGVFAAVKLIGDGHKPGPIPSPVVSKPGGTFRMAVYAPQYIDPSNAISTNDFFAVENLYTGLTTIGRDGSISRAMATDVSNTGCSTWKFTIKEGTKFSDGTPVDAEAFARSWNRTARNKGAGEGYLMVDIQGYSEVSTGSAQSMSGVTTPSPNVLQVTLAKPDCDFEKRVATPVFAPMPSSAGEATNSIYNRAPVGNGPFKVSSYTPNSRLTLVRNPEYAFVRPMLDTVDITLVTDLQAAMNGFNSGQYDWSELQSSTLPAARSAHPSDGKLIKGDIGGMTFLLPINDKGQMASREARQAVSYALDRPAIISSVYQGMYTPATSLVPPSIPGAYVKGCTACVNDPAKAKSLAAQAHLGPGSNVTLSLADSPTYTQLASVVQQQLKTVLGWNVTLRKLPLTKIYTDEASKDAKDLYPLSWVADYPSGENFLYTLLSSDSISGGGNNYAKYHSAAFDSALSTARSTADPNQRIQKVRVAEKIALDDMALIPLYSHTVYRLADTKDFTNPGLDYLGYPSLTTTSRK